MAEKRCGGPGLDAWRRAWTPQEAAARLEGLDIAWCVVGGWSIDLWLGRQTRPHDDLEIAIARADLPQVRAHLRMHRFHAVGDGEVVALRADDEVPADRHQTWVCDPTGELWCVDIMLEPGDDSTWVYRRDPSITRPRAEMIARSSDGIPFLRPEGALLYKAKAMRPKDEADFRITEPALPPTARAWLRGALAQAHSGHPWIDALA